ncbi:MFS transporter, partial [Arthrobacter deserti]|nr:MFS transporter [Arthrobacter deserti]
GAGTLASAWQVPVVWHLAAVAVCLLGIALSTARHLADEDAGRGRKNSAPAAAAAPEQVPVRWTDRRVWLVGVVIIGMAFGEGSGNDWITVAAAQAEGGSESAAAALLTLFLAAVTVVRAAGGPLLDAFGRVNVIRVSSAVAILGLAAFIWSPWNWLAVAGVALWGAGVGLGFPICMSAAADDPVRAAGRVGKVAQVGYLISLVGPPLLGILGDVVGIRNALTVALALLLVSALTAPGVDRVAPARGTRPGSPALADTRRERPGSARR